MMMVYVLVAAVLLQAAPAAKPAPKPNAKTTPAARSAPVAATDIAVSVTYKGKGTVDANHKVIAWLFTDPNITSGSRPVGTQVATKNGETLTFKNAPASPVYLFAVYDEKGGYDGVSGPPPAGLPAVTYRKLPKGAPTAVKGGEQVKLTITDADRWNK